MTAQISDALFVFAAYFLIIHLTQVAYLVSGKTTLNRVVSTNLVVALALAVAAVLL